MPEFSNEPLLEIIYQFIPYDKMFLNELVYNYRSELLDIGQCLQIGSTAVLIRNNSHTQELLDFLDGNGFILRKGLGYPALIEIAPQYSKVTTFEEQLNEIAEKFASLSEEITPWKEVNTTYCALNEPKFEPDVPIAVVITDKFYNNELKINQKEYTTVRAPPQE